jgi:hypothetical protein
LPEKAARRSIQSVPEIAELKRSIKRSQKRCAPFEGEMIKTLKETFEGLGNRDQMKQFSSVSRKYLTRDIDNQTSRRSVLVAQEVAQLPDNLTDPSRAMASRRQCEKWSSQAIVP